MLLSETVELKWNPKIKKHYIDLGYKYTSMGDSFTVDVQDLLPCSNVEVIVSCDYCQKIYKKTWLRFTRENINSTIHNDCCNECKKHKIVDTAINKYGVNSVFRLEDVKEKIANTNLEKYGVENPFASEIIQEQIIKTNIEKYGVAHPLESEKVLKKNERHLHEEIWCAILFRIHSVEIWER